MKRDNLLGKNGLTLITHKNCMDGVGCILATQMYMEKFPEAKLEVIVVDYTSKDIPNVTGKDVVMGDFSFSREVLLAMEEKANSIVVLDHHKTAEENLKGLPFCKFDMTHSGAILVWNYLFDDIEAPLVLQYIEDRDIWNWKLPLSKEVNSGLYAMEHKDLINHYEEVLMPEFVDKLINSGRVVNSFKEKEVRSIIERNNWFMLKIGNFTVPCLNNTNNISEVGNELSRGHYFSLQYFINDDKIEFSLRGTAGYDTTIIAKAFLGGGHKNSSGFSIPLKDFNLHKFFIEHTLEVPNGSL